MADKTIEKGVKTTWITRAEAGRRLGITGQMVGRHCQAGRLPTRSDKRVAWPQAEDWYRRNVVPELSGSWKARQREPGAAVDFESWRAEVEMAERAEAVRTLTSAERLADFARVAKQRFGLSAKQAFAITQWYAFTVLTGLDVADDVDIGCDGDADVAWNAAFGVDAFDTEAAYGWYEQVTRPETTPPTVAVDEQLNQQRGKRS